MMKSHAAHRSTCGRSDVLVRQYSLINPACLSVLLVHQFSWLPWYNNARSFLLIHSCSFVPACSFLLVRQSCWLPLYRAKLDTAHWMLYKCMNKSRMRKAIMFPEFSTEWHGRRC